VRTYRELFTLPEFSVLFGAVSLRVAAGTVSGLALGTLVYARTGSPLLSALSMFGSSFAQVIGALTVLSVADRVPPRRALTAIGITFGLATLVLAIPGMPVWGLLAVIAALGLVGAASGGIQWGLVAEVVPDGAYILGRSVFSMTVGLMQIVGFAAGGLLVTAFSARGTLLVGAGLYLTSALLIRFGLSARPARASGRPSVGQTLRVNAELWRSRPRRYTYLALWVPNGLIVGCEALFVPYAPGHAGLLLMASAAGMLAGDLTAGRLLSPPWRARLITPARCLLAAPYLVFALGPELPVAVIVVAVASVGYSAGLMLQDRLVTLTPPELRGQALGLHSSGLLTMQAVGATLAGTLASTLAIDTTMAVLAVASLLITAVLTPGLRERSTMEVTLARAGG